MMRASIQPSSSLSEVRAKARLVPSGLAVGWHFFLVSVFIVSL